jgi:hypothetical protein
MGKGKTTRKVGETAWLMTRGKGLPILDHGVSHGILTEEDLPLVLEAPRRGHSQKPDEAYHALERLYGDVRRLDMPRLSYLSSPSAYSTCTHASGVPAGQAGATTSRPN